jgi:tetratricopeptide (TPR) repeat protein
LPRKKGRKEIITDKHAQKHNEKARLKGSSAVSINFATLAKIILLIMLAGLTLLLLIGPFYRGLFFTEDLLFAQAAIFALFILWGVYRILTREKELINSPLDLCLILLLLAYVFSYYVAVHKRVALEEILKIASYLAVYLVALELCCSLNLRKSAAEPDDQVANQQGQLPPGLGLILHILMFVATIITIASLGVAAGHWDFIGAYHDAGLRIASPMGYSNTAAAYFMAAYLLTMALAPLARKWWLRALYLAPAALIFTTTILTFSRGAWLLLAPLMLLLILAAAPEHRLRSLLYILATAAPALPAAFIADPIFRSSTPAQAWLPIMAAVAGAIVLGALAELYLAQSRKVKIYGASAMAVTVVVAIIFLLIVPLLSSVTPELSDDSETAVNFTLSKVLPERYYDRIFSPGRNINMEARFEMFRDAVKIIRDYPLFGTGGGGWAALYQGYQDRPLNNRPYFSSEVHNHFLQVWIEAGILGFLAFVGIWLSMAVAFVRNCILNRADSRRWQSWTAVFLPVAALGAHSVIDWNFSMAAVGIYLFTLLGAARSLDNVSWFKNMFQSKAGPNRIGLSNILLLIIGVIFFTGNLVLIAGFNSTARSQEYIEQRNIKMAVPELHRAISLDPLRAENYHNLGAILEEQSRAAQSSADLEAIIYLAGRAYQLEPYNPLYIFRHGELTLNYVDVRSGLDTMDRLLIVRPLSDSSYIQASLARLRLAEYFYNAGRPAEGFEYLDEIDGIASQMQERFGETEPLNYILGRVQLIKGNASQARDFFMAVTEGDPFYELAQQQLQLIEEQTN